MPSWIADYTNMIDAVSEAPTQFNLWAGISVVSAVLKKHVWLNYKTYTLYPNQYIVLVSPPGIGKGSAIHPAHDFAKAPNLANYLSDRVTAPRIIEKLFQGFSAPLKILNGQVGVGAKDASVTLMSSELPTLLTSSDWMLQFLCDAWDRGEFDYDTKNKGSHLVTDMCVGLIGACVPDYIRKINRDANATVSSGFSARTIFVNAKQKSKSLSWGEGFKGNPVYKTTMDSLEKRIIEISNLYGEMTLDSFARTEWDRWYGTIQIEDTDSEAMKYFKGRQHAHVLKVAMTLTASKQTGLIIDRNTLLTAIQFIDTIAEGVDDIFRGVGESDISAALGKLEEYFQLKGVVTYNQMIKDNMKLINPLHIQQAMECFKITGIIDVSDVGGVQHLKWRGTLSTTARQIRQILHP